MATKKQKFDPRGEPSWWDNVKGLFTGTSESPRQRAKKADDDKKAAAARAAEAAKRRKQAMTESLARRGVNMHESNTGRKLEGRSRADLNGIIAAGKKGETDPTRRFIVEAAKNELAMRDTEMLAVRTGAASARSKDAPHGYGAVSMEIGGKRMMFSGPGAVKRAGAAAERAYEDQRRATARVEAAKKQIQSGQVSFDPSATLGLDAGLAAQYGQARAKAMTAALEAIDKDSSFKKPEGWADMLAGDKLDAYSQYLADGVKGRTDVKSYSDIKHEWFQQRKLQQAQERRDIADRANPPTRPGEPGAGFMNQNGGGVVMPSVVNADDLTYGERPGYTGVNGQPYKAGGTFVPSRFKQREESERRMYNQQKWEATLQAGRDAKAFGDYYLTNRKAIETQQALDRERQQAEIERRQQAIRYSQMARHARREAMAPSPAEQPVQPVQQDKEEQKK